MDLAKSYSDIARGLDGFLNLEPLLNSIQLILNDYLPAVYLIAFVLLVVGAMREFLIPETRRFMQVVLRYVLLVAFIAFLPNFIEWCDQAFKALAELPAAQTVRFGDASYAIKSGNGSTVTAIEQVLVSKIAMSNAGMAKSFGNDSSTQGSPQLSGNPFDVAKNAGTVWNYIVGRGVNLVWQILFAIYLLCLLLCKVIIIMMQFLQKVTVIGFKLYAPIGVAEYAHHSLKSKATGFFLTFAGIMTWPVGWSIVNVVTLGVLKSIPGPQDQNFATLIVAIVLAIPVLLWVVIGHVIAPIYMQKIVLRGGGVIQGFAGTIFSIVGAGSMAAYAVGPSGWANATRNGQHGREVGHGTRGPREAARRMGSEQLVLAPDSLLCAEETQKGRKKVARANAAPGGEGDMRFANVGAGVLEAGASLMNRVGSVARFIGHAVGEGGGEGVGLDYRALAAFAPQTATYRGSVNRTNRSSLQARRYLAEE
jgi:hypothetical protein